ncbi:MAG: PAS domain S-box protein [Gemmatimonadales bacterium]
MRDQHKPKQDLINEVIGLRKQVDDLKTSITARRHAEDAVRESDELHRSVLDALPAAVGCLDESGHLLVGNRALGDLLGYDSKSDLLELSQSLGLFADLGEEKRVLARLGSVEGVDRLPARCRSRQGTEVPVAISGGRLGRPGDAIAAFAIVFDPVEVPSGEEPGGAASGRPIAGRAAG